MFKAIKNDQNSDGMELRSASLFESLPDSSTSKHGSDFGKVRPTTARFDRLAELSSPSFQPTRRERRLSLFRPNPYDDYSPPSSPVGSGMVSKTLEVAKSALSNVPILKSLFNKSGRTTEEVDSRAFIDEADRRLSETERRIQALEQKKAELVIKRTPPHDSSGSPSRHTCDHISSSSGRKSVTFKPPPTPPRETPPSPAAKPPNLWERPSPPHIPKPPVIPHKHVTSVIKTIEKEYKDSLVSPHRVHEVLAQTYNDFRSFQSKRRGILGNEIKRLINAQKLSLTSRYIDYEEGDQSRKEDEADREMFTKPTINRSPISGVASELNAEDEAEELEEEDRSEKQASPAIKATRRDEISLETQPTKKRGSNVIAAPSVAPPSLFVARTTTKPVISSRPSEAPSSSASLFTALSAAKISPGESGGGAEEPIQPTKSANAPTSATAPTSVTATPNDKPQPTNKDPGQVANHNKVSELSEAAKPQSSVNQEKNVSDTAEDSALPWWKRNLGKPNMVGIDDSGAFASNAADQQDSIEDLEKPSLGTSPLTKPLFGQSLFGSSTLFNGATQSTQGASQEVSELKSDQLSFRTPTQKGGEGGSLFGGTNQPLSTSLFGNLASSKPDAESTSMFSSVFGKPGEQESRTSIFGGPSTPVASEAPVQQSPMFGAMSSDISSQKTFGFNVGGGFSSEMGNKPLLGVAPQFNLGSNPVTQPLQTPTQTSSSPLVQPSLMGTSEIPKPAGSMFISSPISPQTRLMSDNKEGERKSLFGTPSAGGDLFGNPRTNSMFDSQSNLFAASTPPQGALFGQQQASPSASLFATAIQQSSSQPSPTAAVFGTSGTTALFGNLECQPTSPQTNIFGSGTQSGNLFGGIPMSPQQPMNQNAGSSAPMSQPADNNLFVPTGPKQVVYRLRRRNDM